jgi:peptidoglycan/xylan/chitin deacetylase (PgdA/CDA1 family)
MNTLLTKTDFEGLTGRLMRRWRRRQQRHCINILTYHAIGEEHQELNDGTVIGHDPTEFEQQMDYLVEHYRPMRLSAVVESIERGEQPERAAVVTLDDACGESFRRARDILYRRRIPMTVFPVTSVIGNRDLLWTHKLAWLTRQGHEEKVWAALTAAAYPTREEGEELASYARRWFRAGLPEALEDVLRGVGQSGAMLANALRPYVEEEEISAADPEFIEFGNHTHTHPMLAVLSTEEQRREITAARDAIASLTGRPPMALAYPFGLKRHYNADSKRIARETGHRAALDMRRRINLAAQSPSAAGRIDPFELSRKPAPRGGLAELERVLEDWPANVAANWQGGEW